MSVVSCAMLFIAIFRWTLIARITHDEGWNLGIILNFVHEHVLSNWYVGQWGGRLTVSTGPTVSLPLGVLAHLIGVNVILCRLYVLGVFSAVFYLACRLVPLDRKTIAVTGTFFMLWVTCMPWEPAMNAASINLVGNVFGEGIGFAFALLAIVAATRVERRWRDLFWVSGALAVGAKLVAALALAYPAFRLARDGMRRKSPETAGARGFLVATAVVLGWQAWQLGVLGWEQYFWDWIDFPRWLRGGGGFYRTLSITLFEKFDQLRESRVNPYAVFSLLLFGGALVGFFRKRGLYSQRITKTAGGAVAVYLTWFLLLATRGWMRHLWIAYALLGWLACVGMALYMARFRKRAALPAFVAAVLVLFSAFHGSLWALGPLDASARWRTQASAFESLNERYPDARIFVAGWRAVPQASAFMGRPQHNLYEIPIRRGDLILCDEESSCEPKNYQGACIPQMTSARFGYCVY